MKKISMLILVMLFLLTGCSTQGSLPVLNLDDPRFDGYVPEKFLYYNPESGIRLRVSPMIEATYLAVEMTGRSNDFTNYNNDTPYIETGKERFKEFEDHEFIGLLSSMMTRG